MEWHEFKVICGFGIVGFNQRGDISVIGDIIDIMVEDYPIYNTRIPPI